MACPSPPAAMPAEHPPGLAGRGCGDRVTPNTAGQELRLPQAASQHHQSPCWVAGVPWDVPIPRCPPLWGHPLVRFLLQWLSLRFLNLQLHPFQL